MNLDRLVLECMYLSARLGCLSVYVMLQTLLGVATSPYVCRASDQALGSDRTCQPGTSREERAHTDDHPGPSVSSFPQQIKSRRPLKEGGMKSGL